MEGLLSTGPTPSSLLDVHSMLVSIMTNQLTLTGMSCMLDSQLSIEVKYMAPYGLSFSPRLCFTKREENLHILIDALIYPLNTS